MVDTESKQKVIFAHDHVFTLIGGKHYSNGSFPRAVLERYLVLGDEVTVLSRGKTGVDAGELTLASGPSINFSRVENFRSVNKLAKVSIAFRQVLKEVKSNDVVVARLPSSIGSIAYLAARYYRKPVIVEVVGCAWDASRGHGSIAGKLIAPIAWGLMRVLVRTAPNVIYITKKFLQRRYPASPVSIVAVVPNVEIDEVSDDVLFKRLGKIAGAGSGSNIKLGLIGSLDVNYKGHETLLRAAAILKAAGHNISVHFVGGGDKSRWKLLANELSVGSIVNFPGPIHRSKVLFWLDDIDIQVQPSNAEAQGRAILEGMSRACPVISSNIGGVPELLPQECLITPGSHQELADKLAALIECKDRMSQQASRNHACALEYRSSIIDKRRVAYFTDFLKSPPASK